MNPDNCRMFFALRRSPLARPLFPRQFEARSSLRPGLSLGLGLLTALTSLAASAQSLPADVDALLARAKVPREALAAIVVDAAPALNGKATPLLSYRANVAMNPASGSGALCARRTGDVEHRAASEAGTRLRLDRRDRP